MEKPKEATPKPMAERQEGDPSAVSDTTIAIMLVEVERVGSSGGLVTVSGVFS